MSALLAKAAAAAFVAHALPAVTTFGPGRNRLLPGLAALGCPGSCRTDVRRRSRPGLDAAVPGGPGGAQGPGDVLPAGLDGRARAGAGRGDPGRRARDRGARLAPPDAAAARAARDVRRPGAGPRLPRRPDRDDADAVPSPIWSHDDVGAPRPRGAWGCGRRCGRRGAGTGPHGPPRTRSSTRWPRTCAAAGRSCCTTPTAPRRRCPGRRRWARCRGCWTTRGSGAGRSGRWASTDESERVTRPGPILGEAQYAW